MTTTPKTLTTDEAEKLLTALKGEPVTSKQKVKTIRNHTIALLMLDAGLRVGEVVHLNIEDLYFLNEPRYQLRVTESIAKNKTERIVPLSNRIRKAIEAMQVHVWSNQPPFVPAFFHEYKKGYRILTTRQVERIIRAAAMKSLGRPVHPHMLRHTFGTRLMRTTNSRVVQELLGHSSMTSTQIYTHPNEDDKRKAIDQLGQGEIETGQPAAASSTH
ncbi:Tyrosine recombinase XerC [subsurface metagenome]